MKGLIVIFLFISAFASAQGERKFIREGNKQYAEGKFNEAENSYRSATGIKRNSFEAAYNTANSLYKQGKYDDAAVMYDSLAKWDVGKDKKAKIYYNQGNSYVQAKKLNEGIAAYKNSLRNNPKDEDTKYNLSYAYKLLKKEQDQKKNQDKNKDNKDNKDKNKDNKDKKDKNKDQNKDNKDNKKDDKKDQNKDKKDQQQNQDQQNKDKKDKDKQGAQPQISPEAAQQMLDAIQNDEKAVQKRLEEQKKQGQKVPLSKNW